MTENHALLTDFSVQCAGALINSDSITSSPSTINGCTLVSLLVDAVREASSIIVELYRTNDLLVSEKTSDTDLVTTADIASQSVLVGAIRLALGKDIQVVCEEGDIPPRWGRKQPPLTTFVGEHLQWAQSREWPEYRTDELCLWIDPLDSTMSFASGCLGRVTILVGITLCGRPIGGVICAPFTEVLLFGCEGPGVFIPQNISCGVQALDVKYDPYPEDAKDVPVIATSSRPEDMACTNALNAMKPVIAARLPGAGAKFLLVLSGQADAYLWPRDGLGQWDIVAGSGLVCAIGGKISDKNGDPLLFYEEGQKYAEAGCKYGVACCEEGIVASVRPEIHEHIMKAITPSHTV